MFGILDVGSGTLPVVLSDSPGQTVVVRLEIRDWKPKREVEISNPQAALLSAAEKGDQKAADALLNMPLIKRAFPGVIPLAFTAAAQNFHLSLALTLQKAIDETPSALQALAGTAELESYQRAAAKINRQIFLLGLL